MLFHVLQQPAGCQPDVSMQLEAFCKKYEHVWTHPVDVDLISDSESDDQNVE